MNAQQHPSYDPILDLVEAAQYLKIHPETLKRKARERDIASVRNAQKGGSKVRFRLSALNAWVRAHEIKPLRSQAG